jgi:membrane protein involved in colicin uptake
VNDEEIFGNQKQSKNSSSDGSNSEKSSSDSGDSSINMDGDEDEHAIYADLLSV